MGGITTVNIARTMNPLTCSQLGCHHLSGTKLEVAPQRRNLLKGPGDEAKTIPNRAPVKKGVRTGHALLATFSVAVQLKFS